MTDPSETITAIGANQQWFTPPAWLTAAITPESVCAGLSRQVPEFVSGQLVLSSCEVKRLRLRESQGCWSGTDPLTVEEQAQRQVVAVLATVIPPGLMEPAYGTNGELFGTGQWRCYLPDLRLELRIQPPDTKLVALPN